MELKKTGIAHHRNGISGEPFHVITFQYDDREMVGIVFEAPKHVAVFDAVYLATGVIDFGENSWRGDDFEPELRKMISGEDSAKHVTRSELSEIAATLGRKGGQSRSTAKIAAVRENGKKGGRPRKAP